LVFLQRQRQRLLAEHVLARLQRLDRDLHMPVVRRHDADHVNVFPFEHFAVIAVGVRLAFANSWILPSPLGVIRIDIAYRDDVAEAGVSMGVARAHAAHADATDHRPIVLRLIGERRMRRREVRNHGTGCGQGGRRRQEVATV